MKTPNFVLAVAIAALSLDVASAGDAPASSALQNSPRYLEAHPEWLRARLSGPEFRMDVTTSVAKNSALANSPRFQEVHPEVRLAGSFRVQAVARHTSESELTRNKALAGSPRFLEVYPGLQPAASAIEVAPLK